MKLRELPRICALAAGLAAASAVLYPAPAAAQLFWDWGGGNVVGASGREVVRFSAGFAPGQIIVSFGDRRLYFISRPGEAISYPHRHPAR